MLTLINKLLILHKRTMRCSANNVFACIVILTVIPMYIHAEPEIYEDLLLPYPPGRHGSGRGHRHIRECQPAKYNNVTHETQPSHHSLTNASSQPVEVRSFAVQAGESSSPRTVYGHMVIVNDPARTLSVIEPGGQDGGCQLHVRATVATSAEQRKCLVAVNAGFFNITDFACLGNVVSHGRLAHDGKGIQNSQFGIRKDGSLFFGYLSEDENLEADFEDLVAGVIWLVRDGKNYVDVSKVAECPDAQSTSTLQGFIDVMSGRTAVGHDGSGRVVIVQVDGKTWHRGMSMYEFAELLISFGIVNAINLDGGGSTTMVINGTVVNYPSDTTIINNVTYSVPRRVSTILCVHDYLCHPVDCNGRGLCIHGMCHCENNWHGAGCETLQCGATNCSTHGTCQDNGCRCFAGWHGVNCNETCLQGTYGLECSAACHCNSPTSKCNPVDGSCYCPSGYHGFSCELQCPLGTFGEDCNGRCSCADGCFCDPVTGSCQVTNISYWQAGQCLGGLQVVSQMTTVLPHHEYWLWIVGLSSLAIVAAASLVLNAVLICRNCCQPVDSNIFAINRKARRRKHYRRRADMSPMMDSLSSDFDSDNEYYERNFGNISKNINPAGGRLQSVELVPLVS